MWPARKRLVHTVLLQTEHDFEERAWTTENPDRLTGIEEVAGAVSTKYRRHYNLIAFPGGWFGCDNFSSLINDLNVDIAHEILRRNRRMYIVFGVDVYGLETREMAIVMNYSGIVARAECFAAAEDRLFEFGGRQAFVIACNERRHIPHMVAGMPPAIDLALVLVHAFTPRGRGSGSERYLSSLRSLAKRLRCRVFAPSGFFGNRNIGQWSPGIVPKRRGLFFKETVIEVVPHLGVMSTIISGVGTAQIWTFKV